MMRVTSVSEQQEIIAFAERAAQDFAKDPNMTSFGTIGGGAFLALRWGLGNDCVLVLKQDECFEPVVFGQIIKEVQ